MKPAELSDRKFYCPMVDVAPHKYQCKVEMSFRELFWHFREMHTTEELLAWITAAIWEDVCSGHDPDCA